MKTLVVFRAKPNPAGKDKNKSGHASAAQLGGEWIDVRNTGSYTVDLTSVEVNHSAYDSAGQRSWAAVTTLSGTLGPGQVIRVHSGSGPEAYLNTEDRQGADRHHFTGKNYVWNNDKGDTPALWQLGSNVWIDNTYYDPYPLEGAVLVRRHEKLVYG
jgi:predicted extracellular nuclease